ncbi:MAG TPA: polyprenyl synthetase family protein, partial [Anseongella sp.]|nr:polyprenyl synthetase family protein [Anseongella sp.]
KPRGIDIKEKKITLPLIYSLNKAGKAEKKKIINLVKNHAEEGDKVQEVIDFVRASGGLRYAADVMDRFQAEAFGALRRFPPSDDRDSLEKLVRFTTERNK